MPTNTAFLGMKTYSAVTDGSSLFSTFRADLAGISATSNMGLLDTFASDTSASIVTLNSKSYIVPVDGIYDSANTYLATVADDIASYSTDLVIVLNLDVTSNGTVTLNINSLGAKSLQKVDDTGSLENLTNHDLQEGREYLFKYNGSSFVWMNSTSSDQISIAGNDGEVTFISGSGIITSGSTLDSFASSSEKYIVSELSGALSNELLITAGSGMLLDNDTSSSKVIINSNFISGSRITLNNDISASSITVNHDESGVISGSYSNPTIILDSTGHITSASSVFPAATIVKATGAELDTGTDDAKFLTAKSTVDSHDVPNVVPGTSGNIMTSDGTDWTSEASARATVFEAILSSDATDPTPTADATAMTDIYLHPFNGNKITFPSGNVEISSVQTYSLSGLTANYNYDVFIDNTLSETLEIWTDDTTRATDIVWVNGQLVSDDDNDLLYIGTVRITGTTGQCEDSELKRFLWNYYNRREKLFYFKYETNYTYSTNTLRQMGGNTANKVEFVIGVEEDFILTNLLHYLDYNNVEIALISMGLDSITTTATKSSVTNLYQVGATTVGVTLNCRLVDIVPIGYHYIAPLEIAISGTVTFTGAGGKCVFDGSIRA